ncbi:MAG: glycosyltransferase [Acidimicrobiales bacterium]
MSVGLDHTRPRLLVLAFACSPGVGSEPGAGWGVVRALSSFADLDVLVGPEHTAALAEWSAANPTAHSIRFHTVPEPFWSRGPVRRAPLLFLVYLAWMRRALPVARELVASKEYAAVVQATYSPYWLPSIGAQIGLPLVWGPVGGAVRTPLRLWRLLGLSGVLSELRDLVAVRACARLPRTRATWRAAALAIVNNEETLAALDDPTRQRGLVLNHGLFTDTDGTHDAPPSRDIVWCSAMESRKGPLLAVHALARLDRPARLVMIGDGPQRRRVQRAASRLGVADDVEFTGRVPRDEAIRRMSGAAATLFTGLREEGGLALSEALLLGTPTVVLAHGGARTIAEAAVDPARVALVQPGSLDEAAARLAAALDRLLALPAAPRPPLLDVDTAVRRLEAAVRAVITSP